MECVGSLAKDCMQLFMKAVPMASGVNATRLSLLQTQPAIPSVASQCRDCQMDLMDTMTNFKNPLSCAMRCLSFVKCSKGVNPQCAHAISPCFGCMKDSLISFEKCSGNSTYSDTADRLGKVAIDLKQDDIPSGITGV